MVLDLLTEVPGVLDGPGWVLAAKKTGGVIWHLSHGQGQVCWVARLSMKAEAPPLGASASEQLTRCRLG